MPSTEVPADIRKLSAPAQVALLERRARTGTVADRLFYGVALQRLGKQRSAERVYAAAATAAPKDPEARVAAAVGLFDKARPAQAFPKLGPLSREFPKAATVRFHLGLLLLWSGQVKEARRQLELVRTAEPGSPLIGHRRPVSGRASQGGYLDLRRPPPPWRDFLTGDVSDRYGHSGSMKGGGAERS